MPGITADRQRCDRCGFGAQDVRDEGYRRPPGIFGQGALAIGPAALRTGEEGDGIFGSAGGFRRKSADERRGAGLFFKEVTIG